MPIAMQLDGESCPECGEETLYWWSKDETESVMEVYMNCDRDDGCGYEFPKVIVNKSDDTSDDALKAKLRNRYL